MEEENDFNTPDFEKSKGGEEDATLDDEDVLAGSPPSKETRQGGTRRVLEEEQETDPILRLLPVKDFEKRNSALNKSLVEHLSQLEQTRATAKKEAIKWTLWGAGVGATSGGAVGAGVGIFGTPAGSLALGAGGAAVLGVVGSFVGGLVGQVKEKQLNDQIDKELIEHVHNNTWLPDEDCNECMKCKAAFGLFTRRHHCRICGGVFCYNHCFENVPIKYFGVDKEQIQRLCVDCAKEYRLEREKVKENESEGKDQGNDESGELDANEEGQQGEKEGGH